VTNNSSDAEEGLLSISSDNLLGGSTESAVENDPGSGASGIAVSTSDLTFSSTGTQTVATITNNSALNSTYSWAITNSQSTWSLACSYGSSTACTTPTSSSFTVPAGQTATLALTLSSLNTADRGEPISISFTPPSSSSSPSGSANLTIPTLTALALSSYSSVYQVYPAYRLIKLTNSGSVTAQSLSFSPSGNVSIPSSAPPLPSGITDSACGSSLAAGSSCYKWVQGIARTTIGASSGSVTVSAANISSSATMNFTATTYLYAAGYILLDNTPAAYDVQQFNGSTWSNVGTGMTSPVNSLAVDGYGILYAGSYDGPYSSVAKFTGQNWSVVGQGFGIPVNSLAVSFDGSSLYAGTVPIVGYTTTVWRIAIPSGTSWAAVAGANVV
jgi:hypothetical protein